MTFEILSTPVNSPASLIFQQCLAEVDPENRSLNSAMNEVGGYFLNKSDILSNTEPVVADEYCGKSGITSREFVLFFLKDIIASFMDGSP